MGVYVEWMKKGLFSMEGDGYGGVCRGRWVVEGDVCSVIGVCIICVAGSMEFYSECVIHTHHISHLLHRLFSDSTSLSQFIFICYSHNH